MMHDRFLLIERRGLLRASAILSLGALAGCTTSKVLTPESGTSSDQTEASLDYVNKLRKGKGLTDLVADHAASLAAMNQAVRMAKVGKMQHLIGWNDSFYDRMKGQGVTLPAAENIAMGQDDAERAYDAWYKSPKHLENMLGNYRGLGVAVAQSAASDNRPFWAMVLSG